MKVFTCSNCEEVKSEILYASGEHYYINGKCRYCRLDFAEVTDVLYNGSYGYEYFRTLPKASAFCGLYDAIDERVKSFHYSETLNATQTNDGYEFFTADYTDFGLTADEAIAVYKTYLDDKPLYYWVEKNATIAGTNIVLYADEQYATATTRYAYNQNLYEKLEGYKDIAAGESAYSVALAYHDEIIKKIDYAYKSGSEPEDANWAHNITGVFDGVGAVCEGYARSFQLLLNMRGIENILVTGTGAKENHAWNLVKLDNGKWYWYDLTYDDTPNNYWGVSHKYAFTTDTEFLKNHTVGSSAEYGVDFMPELPSRANAVYTGKEILYRNEFTVDGLTYTVDGYDSVYLSYIGVGGDCVIPETVIYCGREFTVVGLVKFNNNSAVSISSTVSIFSGWGQPEKIIKSVSIPKSVLYIDYNAFGRVRRCGLENIFVDQDNPGFTSVDGVLFTKNMTTLAVYPEANPRTSYAIPDETKYLAYNAFDGILNYKLNLETLYIGKSLREAGVVFNNGVKYPDTDTEKVYYLSGFWNMLLRALVGKKEVFTAADSEYYFARDGLLSHLLIHGYSIDAMLPLTEHLVITEDYFQVESNAFIGYESLKSVKFLTVLIGEMRFHGCSALESVILPEGMTYLSDRVFAGCSSLKEVIIPSTVKRIGEYAFSNSTISSITIPAGVKTIGESAFSACSSLKKIIVEEGNTAYKVSGNCLIDIATGKLICAYGDFTIPSDGSVTSIGTYAFSDYDFTRVVIPDGVTDVGRNDLYECLSLNTLVIPSSVETIVYLYLRNTVNTFYKGTETQWNAVVKSGYFGTVYFYSEDEPNAAGKYWHYVDGEPVIW